MSEAERNEHLAAHAESCDDSDRMYERCPVCARLRQDYAKSQILGGAGASFGRFQYVAGRLEIGTDPEDYDQDLYERLAEWIEANPSEGDRAAERWVKGYFVELPDQRSIVAQVWSGAGSPDLPGAESALREWAAPRMVGWLPPDDSSQEQPPESH